MLDHIIASRVEEKDGNVDLEELGKEVLVDVVRKLEWNAGMAGCTWGVCGAGLVLDRKYYFEMKTEEEKMVGVMNGKMKRVDITGAGAGSSKSGV